MIKQKKTIKKDNDKVEENNEKNKPHIIFEIKKGEEKNEENEYLSGFNSRNSSINFKRIDSLKNEENVVKNQQSEIINPVLTKEKQEEKQDEPRIKVETDIKSNNLKSTNDAVNNISNPREMDRQPSIELKDFKGQIVKCPLCNTFIEFEGGCYFIQCASNFCKGSKYFCFICKRRLENAEKSSHYEKGPYSYHCKNISLSKIIKI